MKRRLLSLFVALAMTMSMVVVGAGAVEPTYGDTAGHWAESAIERWSGHGIIQGSNGEFDPNGPLTCAQLATILAKLLKLPAAKDAGFNDNAAGAWYYDAINRCAAAGILNGNGDGTVDPNGAISRERAMVMLGRALGIKPLENPDLTKFSDAAKVASYAQGMVAALIAKGIVGGVTSDTLAPQDDINRASTVTILDRAIGSYADKAGETVKVEGKGIVLVVADDVTITGDVEQLIVPADNVDVTVSGCKDIDSIIVTGENSKVILENSSASDVTLDSKNTEIETKGNSKVDSVNVSEDAAGATVNAGNGTTIGSVENKAENTTVTGNGLVKEVASDKDMTVETKDTEVKNTGDEKISVTDKNGKTTETAAGGSSTTGGTTTGGSSGSSSGGGSSHSHSFAAEWTFDDTYHWHEASCGLEGHRADKAAHTEAIDAAVAATCTETGLTEGKHCSVCNKVLVPQAVIPALGHNFNGGDTCTACGFTKCVEVWTGYSGEKVGSSYATIEEAAANLDGNKWIVIAGDYTLDKDLTIPEGVAVDVATGATLTVAEGVTVTIAKHANRLCARADAEIINNGTILVCGGGTSAGESKFMLMNNTTSKLSGNALSVPNGYLLVHNGNAYYAGEAFFEITYSDGTKELADNDPQGLTNAKQLTLLKDLDNVSLSFDTTDKLANDFVLDLGGHTLQSHESTIDDMLSISVPMTITNGKIVYRSNNANKGALRTSADVTLADSLTVNGGAGYGVNTEGYSGSTLTVNGKVTSNGAYAITGNGRQEVGGDIANCSIVINNGAEVSAPDGIAVYHPEKGTVTVNGGTISGHTGVQMCAGKLVVNGGSITASGDAIPKTNGDGGIKDGAAISIVNRSYPGGVPEAEIKGGAFTAKTGNATIQAYVMNGTTVSEWSTAGEKINITGGTFSSIPANMDDLCAAGYIPKAVAGGFEVARGSYVAAVTHVEASDAEIKYATLDDALAALHDGDTLTLLTDLTETLTVTVPCSVNLNGHSIAAADGPAVNAALTGGWDASENKSVLILDMSDGPHGMLTSQSGSAVAASADALCQVIVSTGSEDEAVTLSPASGSAPVSLAKMAFVEVYGTGAPTLLGDGAAVFTVREGGSPTYYFGENGLAGAIAKANENDTVTLLRDVSADEKLTIPNGASLVLDLNGKTYTTDSKIGIEIKSGGELTVKGGRIVSEAAEERSYAVQNGGTLTIEDGTTITVSNGSCTCVSNNGTLNIKGGELDARNGGYWLKVLFTKKTTRIKSVDIGKQAETQ